MKQIFHNEDLHALIVTTEDFQAGWRFFSDPEWSLQLGLMTSTDGHVIPAHLHRKHEGRTVPSTQEFLLVVSGRMEVDFYDESAQCFQTETVLPGEAVLQVRGGHGFRFPEATRLIEVKQGPYLGKDKDKISI
jgi:mannose-6-phosphate isomerase-like protein (cupin superfamily)